MIKLRLVVLESPFGSLNPRVIEENVAYAREALRDCLLRSEAPIASHLLYPQAGVLDDNIEVQRRIGLEAGWAWMDKADAVVVYQDRGISSGMLEGIEEAKKRNLIVEYRSLRKGNSPWRVPS